MNTRQKVSFVVILIVVAFIIIEASTGFFGITGNAAYGRGKLMREGTVYRIDLNDDKYLINVLSITNSNQVMLDIERINNTNQEFIAEQIITAVSDGEEVKLSPKMGKAVVSIEKIKESFSWEYAYVRLERPD